MRSGGPEVSPKRRADGPKGTPPCSHNEPKGGAVAGQAPEGQPEPSPKARGPPMGTPNLKAGLLLCPQSRASQTGATLIPSVPPTVMLAILIVGQPTPTGTLCPSFPQVQIPSEVLRRCRASRLLRSTSGPLPIRFTPLSGAVIFPPSTR